MQKHLIPGRFQDLAEKFNKYVDITQSSSAAYLKIRIFYILFHRKIDDGKNRHRTTD